MTIPKFSSLSGRWMCVVVPLVLAWASVADAQVPAQMPLLSRVGAGVPPNIMVLMDDSGSMGFRHMPEEVFASDTFITTNPVKSNGVVWDRKNNYQRVNFVGTVPGILAPPNYVLPALRSPDTNTIFYNPEIRYQPWFFDDGVTRRPNSPVTAAYSAPPLQSTTATTFNTLTPVIGNVSFTLSQTGKSFAVGQRVVVSSTTTPGTAWMMGRISAFTAGTGAMTVQVTQKAGAATFAQWDVVQQTDNSTIASSTTTNTPGIALKTFTITQNNKLFLAEEYVMITATASPTVNWMFGQVRSYNTGTKVLTVNVTQSGGSTSLSRWDVVQSQSIDLTQIRPNGTFTAGSFVVGATYTIVTTGTTNFVSVGAANSTPGTVFIATGVGSGTGTASSGTLNGGTTGWCYATASITGNGSDAGQGCQAPTVAFLHDPGVYFRLTKSGATYNDLTAIGNYTAYSINGAATFPKVLARTDCSGAVGPSGCTQAEERQNFANWYTYYQDRNLLARGAMMEAFAPDPASVSAGAFVVNAKYRIATVGTTSFTSIGAAANTVGTVFTATGAGSGTGTAIPVTFRMGFGRINKGATTVDTVSTIAIEDSATYVTGGVRDYTGARRVNWFKWLEDLPVSGSTALVPAFEAIGDYYMRTDNRGPWTDDPSGVVANTVANNKTCRRSYQIAMTDGYWNTTAGTKDNADATATASITGVGTSYPGYTPSFPYKDVTANTLADSAMYYWVTDLQPAMDNAVRPVGKNISFWQNMTTFTVGLGVRGTLDPKVDMPALIAGTKVWPPAGTGQTTNNVDDLWHAAVNSRGEYFSVKDPKELSDAIKSVLATATGEDKPTAGVATASTTLTTSNYKYVPEFQQQSWSGDVKAYKLNGVLGDASVVWSAAAKLPALWSDRNIVTWDTGLTTPAGVAFDWSVLTPSNQAALGAVAATHTTSFTNFLRGDHSLEGVGNPFRERLDKNGIPFRLGDFMNANPVAVLDSVNGLYGNLNLGVAASPTDPTYAEFLVAKKARTSVLFAGANDGMLHGFKDSRPVAPAVSAADDGKEVFAYVPRAVYSNLYKLTDKTYGQTGPLQHQYFVDGPLRESDAYVKAPGATFPSWRNYLVGTLGAGGRAVYALDVTNLAGLGTNTLRWEISDTDDVDLGYVLAPVKVGVLANGRWVAIFGNGFSSTNGYATLFVVDIEKAADHDPLAIQKLNVDTSGGNGLGGVTLIHDVDGKITTVYAGDLKGKMWKLDYNAATASKFEISGSAALFQATDGGGTVQPITASPVVYNHAQGGRIVVFGTGKLFADTDALDTSVQTVYAVWDKSADSFTRPLVRSNLTGRTLTSFMGTGLASSTKFVSISDLTAINWTTSRGWRIDLGGVLPGGRVVYPALVGGFDTAVISAVAPAQGVLGVCDSLTGTGLNLLLPVQSGLNPDNKNFDTDGSGSAGTGDSFSVGYSTAADGVDVVVRSPGADGISDGINDAGGGGHEGDCTGATCSVGQDCLPDPLCPEEHTCLSTIQSAQAGMTICIKTGQASTRKMDRVWRRIINPPIH